MPHNITKIQYIWIVCLNSGYICHYGPDSLLLWYDDIMINSINIFLRKTVQGFFAVWGILLLRLSLSRMDVQMSLHLKKTACRWSELFSELWQIRADFERSVTAPQWQERNRSPLVPSSHPVDLWICGNTHFGTCEGFQLIPVKSNTDSYG